MTAHEAHRSQASGLMLEEARRIRAAQDERVDDLRRRSVTVLTIVTGAVVLVAGLSDDDGVSSRAIYIASVLVAIMVGAALVVHWPWSGYLTGPNIDQLAELQYNEAHPGHRVERDLACYHYSHFNSNEDGPIKRMQLAFVVELIAAGAAAVIILLGATA